MVTSQNHIAGGQIKASVVLLPLVLVDDLLSQMVCNIINFGRWLKCELHFLCSSNNEEVIKDLTTDFMHHYPDSPTLIIHPLIPDQIESIMSTIQSYNCDMMLLQDSILYQKNEDETGVLRIIELSPIPVLLLPKNFDFQLNACDTFLVPLSGESRISKALALSLKIALQTESFVDLLHVASKGQPCSQLTLEALGDQFQHEYPQITEMVASESCPYSTAMERARIRRLYHCQGSIAEEIIHILKKSPNKILALEWEETLARSSSETIKGLFKDIFYPILFVKAGEEKGEKLGSAYVSQG